MTRGRHARSGPDRAARRGGTAPRKRLDGRPAGSAALADVTVTGVTHDSRAVVPGSLFVAVRASMPTGTTSHQPRRAGGRRRSSSSALPRVGHRATRRGRAWTALASAAAWWFGDPSHQLTVTGSPARTARPTTPVYIVLEAAGRRAGMVTDRDPGRWPDRRSRGARHDPQAPELQATLRAMVDAGDDVAVVETTSHGLALDRVASVAYDVAILTNSPTSTSSSTGRGSTATRSCRCSIGAGRARPPQAGAGRRHRCCSTIRRHGRSSAPPATRVPASSPTAPRRPRTCGRSTCVRTPMACAPISRHPEAEEPSSPG